MVLQPRSNEGYSKDHVSGSRKKRRNKEGSGSRININWQVMWGVPDERLDMMTKSFSKQHSFLRNINSAIAALFPLCCFILPGSTSTRSGQWYKSALIATMMRTELIYSRWTRIMKSFSFLSMVCAASSLLIHFSVWPFKLTRCSLLRLFKDIYLSTEKWKPDIQDRLIFVCESSCHFCSARVCYHVWTSNYSLG